jgi:uncharacterized membrane protein
METRRGLARVFSFRSEHHARMRSDHFFAFSDGVFAIITTLLVLDLKLPEHVPDGQLAHALWELKPSFAAYAIGFLQTFGAWATVHRLSHRIRYVDQWMIVIFGLTLAFATLVPFSTAVLAKSFGEPANFKTAMALVTFVGGMTSGLFLFGTNYALNRGMGVEGTTDEQLQFGRRLGGASMIGWLIAFGLSFVVPWAALPMVVWGYAIALLPNRVDEFPVVT